MKPNAYFNLDQQQSLPPIWVETTEEFEDLFVQVNEDLEVLQEKTNQRFKQNFDAATDDQLDLQIQKCQGQIYHRIKSLEAKLKTAKSQMES